MTELPRPHKTRGRAHAVFFAPLRASPLPSPRFRLGKRRAIGQGEGVEMNFASDNGAGVAAPILEAIVASSRVNAPAYGADAYSARAEAMLSEIFERPVKAFLTPTGTGANALALARWCVRGKRSSATRNRMCTTTNAARRSSSRAAPSSSAFPASPARSLRKLSPRRWRAIPAASSNPRSPARSRFRR